MASFSRFAESLSVIPSWAGERCPLFFSAPFRRGGSPAFGSVCFREALSRFAGRLSNFPSAAGERCPFFFSRPGRPDCLRRLVRLRPAKANFFSLTRGWLSNFSQLCWGTLSAFLLFSVPAWLKEEKRTEKKFKRTGLLERHSPSGLGVAATCAVALVLR